VSWDREFEESIPLPKGKPLIALCDAANYMTRLPKTEHEAPEWQVAMEARCFLLQRVGRTGAEGVIRQTDARRDPAVPLREHAPRLVDLGEKLFARNERAMIVRHVGPDVTNEGSVVWVGRADYAFGSNQPYGLHPTVSELIAVHVA
jgi:hypothetical protein